jgi:phage shock protein A
MGVFSRMSDIVNANINAMLDKAEDPDKIVRLIIQEMEDTLVEVRSRTARALADKKEIERRKLDCEARALDWEAKAELAIAKGRDDLAKAAIAAKRSAQEMAELMVKERTAIEESLVKANDDLEKLQLKLKEAKAKQRSLEIRRRSAYDRARVSRTLYDGRIDAAMDRYDRYERRIDELEAEAETYVMGRPKSLEAEFRELASEDDVNAEFEALKKRVADRSSGGS